MNLRFVGRGLGWGERKRESGREGEGIEKKAAAAIA